jgi:hypothetical protein
LPPGQAGHEPEHTGPDTESEADVATIEFTIEDEDFEDFEDDDYEDDECDDDEDEDDD